MGTKLPQKVPQPVRRPPAPPAPPRPPSWHIYDPAGRRQPGKQAERQADSPTLNQGDCTLAAELAK